jgi:dolichyl-phosphate-mannose--protein O-mannosyl transferase
LDDNYGSIDVSIALIPMDGISFQCKVHYYCTLYYIYHITYCLTCQVADTGSLYLSGATGSLTPAVVTTTSNIVYLFFSSHASNAFSVSTSIYNWRATYTAITV